MTDATWHPCLSCCGAFPVETLEDGACRTCRKLPQLASDTRRTTLDLGVRWVSFDKAGAMTPLAEKPSDEEVADMRRALRGWVVDLEDPDAVRQMIPHLRRSMVIASELARSGLIHVPEGRRVLS